jgi:Fe-S cluster biogenesis protein NfuA
MNINSNSKNYWKEYSDNYNKKILSPQFVGFLEDEKKDDTRVVVVSEKVMERTVVFYILIDEKSGDITDIRFQVTGEAALIGAAEIICATSIHKNYLFWSDVEITFFEKYYGNDNSIKIAFEIALRAISKIMDMCFDLSFKNCELDDESFSTMEDYKYYKGWKKLSKEKQLTLINEVIEREILPHIALDGGGVKIVDIKDNNNVIIEYLGACVNCHAATGSTLSFIEHTLRKHLHKELSVIPDFSL